MKNTTNRFIQAGSLLLGSAFMMSPVMAHHAMDGKLASTAVEGLMSGLAHPVIGLDHLAFIVALGCSGALVARSNAAGKLMPIGFLGAALLGTMIHLQSIDLPFNELWVALSVLLLGMVVGLGQKLPIAGLAALVTIAGLFHGYAYGESIVGAGMTPLVSYLVGFTAIQAAISYGAYFVATKFAGDSAWVKAMGFITAGIGISAVLGAIGG